MYNSSAVQIFTSFKPDSYTCCEACAVADDCAFGAWDSKQRICYLQRQIDGTCPAQGETGGVYREARRNGTEDAYSFVAFNG